MNNLQDVTFNVLLNQIASRFLIVYKKETEIKIVSTRTHSPTIVVNEIRKDHVHSSG